MRFSVNALLSSSFLEYFKIFPILIIFPILGYYSFDFHVSRKSSNPETQRNLSEMQQNLAEVQRDLEDYLDDFEGYLNFDEGWYM